MAEILINQNLKENVALVQKFKFVLLLKKILDFDCKKLLI